MTVTHTPSHLISILEIVTVAARKAGSGEFDELFHVSGEDEAFARDFLDSGMKRFLMADMTFRWQVRGPHAMLVWPHSFDVKDVEMMLFALKRFVEAMPEGVVGKHGSS